jgi:hypothetical protein
MRNLTDEQVDLIAEDIRARGVFTQSLQEDLLDHICCFIEEQDDERPFGDIYQRALDAFGQSGLQGVQDETLYLINQPYQRAMKKFAYITGSIASISLISGAFFKIMHWPGASVLLLLGTLTLSMFFIPYFFFVNLKEQTDKKSKVIAAFGLVTALFLCAAALFKIFHWPGTIMIMGGFGLSFLIFLPLYIINGVRNPLTKVSSISNGFLFAAIGGFVMLMSFQQPSKMVTDSLTKIESNQDALIADLKLQLNDTAVSPVTRAAITEFLESCDASLAHLASQTGEAALGDGVPIVNEQLDALNSEINAAVVKLNASMATNPAWTSVAFENLSPTVYGSAKFQVLQLETRASVNAIH